MKILQDLRNVFSKLFGGAADDDFKRHEEPDALYAGHPEAVIVTCYFNPLKSPARRRAFERFYQSISHLNHRVVECVIGASGSAELPENENISRVYTRDLLWHKEALINYATATLPAHFRYVFWIDADVLLTNPNWLPEAVARLAADARIVQPFEFAVHLVENEGAQPSFDVNRHKPSLSNANALRNGGKRTHQRVWRSFAANWETCPALADSPIYDQHGHVGLAWGARRELLEAVPLYDRALVGGADHIIAHAAAGQIPSACIDKSFTADLKEVYEWSRRFALETQSQLAFVPGDIYHLWHGDLEKRDYLNRIREFTPLARSVRGRDDFGLYTTDDQRVTDYVENYFYNREVQPLDDPIAGSQSTESSPVFSRDKLTSTNDTGESWNGGGGGGDFAGGGAGGDWSGEDISNSSSTDYQTAQKVAAEASFGQKSSAAEAEISDSDLSVSPNDNFS